MVKHTGRNANSYWLTLAAWYGLTIGVATMTAMPWLLVVGCVFIVFPLIVGLFYGQIGRKVQYELVPDSPAIVITATAFGTAAMFLHGSPIAAWAGPLLGLATFIATYFCLRRYGHFYGSADATSLVQQRDHAG